MSELDALVTGNVYSFLMIFVRTGTIVMLLPGIGDNFVTPKVRLFFALAFSLVMTPLLAATLPPLPANPFALFVMISVEAVIGLFIGLITRILLTALSTGGMVISMQSGLANAQVFIPTVGGQGSLAGALLTVAGLVLMFATDLHHVLILAVHNSYTLFPVGQVPPPGDMADLVARMVSRSFMIGVQIAAPFIVVGLLLYLGLGVLARLMPQIQVFFLALPVQILVSLVTMALVLSAALLFWLKAFQDGLMPFLGTP